MRVFAGAAGFLLHRGVFIRPGNAKKQQSADGSAIIHISDCPPQIWQFLLVQLLTPHREQCSVLDVLQLTRNIFQISDCLVSIDTVGVSDWAINWYPEVTSCSCNPGESPGRGHSVSDFTVRPEWASCWGSNQGGLGVRIGDNSEENSINTYSMIT